MSYILDALKRSEQERHQDKMPSFSAENMIIQTNQKKAHWWPFVLILVLILNAIILFIYKSDIFMFIALLENGANPSIMCPGNYTILHVYYFDVIKFSILIFFLLF